MEENSNVVRLRHADEIDDPLTNILRSGARRLLAQAVEFEADAFLAGMKDLKLADGRDRVVRHGHGPVRTIQTGVGPVEVERVKIRDRGVAVLFIVSMLMLPLLLMLRRPVGAAPAADATEIVH